MSLKFRRIQQWTAELAALDQFKKSFIREYSKYFDDLLSGERFLPNLKNLLFENIQNIFDDLLSGERLLPFGLLVKDLLL